MEREGEEEEEERKRREEGLFALTELCLSLDL